MTPAMQSDVSLAREMLVMLLCMVDPSVMYPRLRVMTGLFKLLAQSLGLPLQKSACGTVAT
jgi:hypothetical protein